MPTAPLLPSPTAGGSVPARRRVAGVLVGALAVMAVLGACSRTAASGGAAPGEAAAGAEALPPAPTTTQPPDTLASPGVVPGTCGAATYTPPTAKEAFQGELCRPATDQRDVAVILVHGGGGFSGTYAGMKPWADRLNAEGYVTFAVEYHLFAEYGGGPVFPWPEQNLKAAVQYLRGTANALGIRRDRIAVEGFSAGARLGAEAFTTPDDPYFAGPELWPDLSDAVNAYIGFYHPLDGSMQQEYTYYGGPEDSPDPVVRQRWEMADSLAHADRAKGPAVLFTGDADWDIQITQGQEFVQRLQAAGQRAHLGIIPGGGHGFDQGDGVRLTRLGEASATGVLIFLNTSFPQVPARQAQTVGADLASSPTNTGVPPTTYTPRAPTTYQTGRPGTSSGNTGATRSPSTTSRPARGATAGPTPTYVPPTVPPVTAPRVTTPPPTAPKPSTPPSSTPASTPPTSSPKN